MSSDRVKRDREIHERRESFDSSATILAMLRPSRWSLARLLLEGARGNVLDDGQFFSKIRPPPRPFRLISQPRDVNEIHSFWEKHPGSMLSVKFCNNPVGYSEYLDACKLIYDKAPSQITSQPRPSGSEGSDYLTSGFTQTEIDQIEVDIQTRVKKLAMNQGLMTRFKPAELPLPKKEYLAISPNPFLSCN